MSQPTTATPVDPAPLSPVSRLAEVVRDARTRANAAADEQRRAWLQELEPAKKAREEALAWIAAEEIEKRLAELARIGDLIDPAAAPRAAARLGALEWGIGQLQALIRAVHEGVPNVEARIRTLDASSAADVREVQDLVRWARLPLAEIRGHWERLRVLAETIADLAAQEVESGARGVAIPRAHTAPSLLPGRVSDDGPEAA